LFLNCAYLRDVIQILMCENGRAIVYGFFTNTPCSKDDKEKTTHLTQPLDTTFHRQFKYYLKCVVAALELFEGNTPLSADENWTSRFGVIKLISLAHHQLSAPIFIPMVKQCWYTAGLSDECHEFLNVKEACFTLLENKNICQMSQCHFQSFTKCAQCRKALCMHHLWFEKHLYQCENTPF